MGQKPASSNPPSQAGSLVDRDTRSADPLVSGPSVPQSRRCCIAISRVTVTFLGTRVRESTERGTGEQTENTTAGGPSSKVGATVAQEAV